MPHSTKALHRLAIAAALILLVGLLPATAAPTLRRGITFEVWQTWTNKDGFLDPGFDRANFPDWMARVDDRQLSHLKTEGFDFVRLNVDASPFFWVGADAAGLLIDQVVAATLRLQADGFVVVVDLHLLPTMDDRPDGIHDVLGTGGYQPRLFSPYLALVSRLAARLAQLPADRTAFEPINEPNQDWDSHLAFTDKWPAQLAALYAAARSVAPRLTLVLTGGRSGGIDGLTRLDPAPFADDANIIWTFHYYDPMAVSHAGQPWEQTPGRFLTHLPYPASKLDDTLAARRLKAARRLIASVVADRRQRQQLSAGVDAALADYRASGASATTIAADFASVADWARRNDIATARILLGEFGVFQTEADPTARTALLEATRQAAEQAGFAWSVYTAGLTQAGQSFSVIGDNRTLALEPAVRAALGLAGN